MSMFRRRNTKNMEKSRYDNEIDEEDEEEDDDDEDELWDDYGDTKEDVNNAGGVRCIVQTSHPPPLLPLSRSVQKRSRSKPG